MRCKKERKEENHTKLYKHTKNETLECHGQDQQTVIDEILFGKIK